MLINASQVFGRSDVVGNSYNTTNSLAFTQYVMDSWSKAAPLSFLCLLESPDGANLVLVSFARTHDPQPSQKYLAARGAAYESTLRISSKTHFPEYASSKDGLIHHFDLPPSNSGPVYPARCQMYENSGGYTHDRINNAM
jgi:hypothetical protein